MMRFQALLTTGMGSLFVASALTSPGNDLAKLEAALENTLRGLEILSSVEERVAVEPDQAPRLVMAVTEAPMLEERARDERLADLRNEVNLLQMELDLLDAPVTTVADDPVPVVNEGLELLGIAPHQAPTGIGDDLRSLLGSKGAPAQGPVETQGPKPLPEPVEAKEFAGYSADALAQGKACYLAGQYERGLQLLERLPNDGPALYWKARCLEKLNRLSEAEAALEAVLLEVRDPKLQERAKSDLEFVRWKRGFEEKLAREGGKGGKR